MKKREKELHNDPWDPDFYETGSTRPPKNRGGIVAVLLVLVILLGSTCSALGIINLHLLWQLTQEPQNPGNLNVFASSPQDSAPSAIVESGETIRFPRMGLEGQTVSEFDRLFYSLPQGFLVTAVTENTSAHTAGIHAGDVITKLGGQAILSQEDLADALRSCPAGEAIPVEFFRHQTEQPMSTTITLPKE